MYHSSTQKKHWTFRDVDELSAIRQQSNQRFCQHHHQATDSPLLSASEEFQLFRYYQKKLVELCNLFAPPKWLPLPRSALATAVAYFKRFYLYTSVMEYHPQDIYLCCTFLAFKIDEYNVTLEQYLETLSPFFPTQQLESISDFILTHELFLLQKLKFHMTIHSPFRPLSGFIIDMKTRTNDFPDPDQFKNVAEQFLLLSLHSDVSLLYPPSQIALAAVCHAGRQTETKTERYMASILLNSETLSTREALENSLIKIQEMVLATKLPDRNSISVADQKLSHFLTAASKDRKRKSEEGGAKASKKLKPSEPEEDIVGIDRL